MVFVVCNLSYVIAIPPENIEEIPRRVLIPERANTIEPQKSLEARMRDLESAMQKICAEIAEIKELITNHLQ